MISISGDRLRAVEPGVVIAWLVTLPRSCPGLSPDTAAARLIADSERMICDTVFGFVARLWIWPPPLGANGCPTKRSVVAS